MNEHQPAPEQTSEAQASETQPGEEKPAESQAPESPAQDPRRRLRELLAVPERDRSDAVWDEIASLEIELAPGNRISPNQGDPGRGQEQPRRQDQGRRPDQQARRGPPQPGAQPGKRFFQRPRRGPRPPNKP